MRRRYETEEDLVNERQVIEALRRASGLDAIKLPENSRADYLMHAGGRASSVVEIKCRNVSSARWPTYMISRAKYEALLGWVDRGFKAAIAVRWTDCIGLCPVPAPHTVEQGGRFDRGDAFDIEEMVHIDMKHFTIIEEIRL